MKANLLGMGQWLPERIRTAQDWPEEFVERVQKRHGDRELVDVPLGDRGDLCDRIVAQHVAAEAEDPFLGSQRRRIADDHISSCEAERRAGEAALADAGIDPADLDMIVSWAALPDRITPPSATRIAHDLGATRAFALGLDAGCATALSQLAYAAAMVVSGQVRTVLLTQAHLITRAFPMMHPASPNVGDAATALVVGTAPGHEIIAHHAVTHGEFYDAVTWMRGRDLDAPWWEAGPAFYLGSKNPTGARTLVQNAVRLGAQTVRELMVKIDLPIDCLDVLISVQPRGWIPGAIAEVLGLPAACAPNTFAELAHLGPCGTVTNLIAAREAGMLTPGRMVGFYAQGAGFTRASALIRW